VDVLIKEDHEGYITWEEFERNQRLMADNANRRRNIGRGSIRHGEAFWRVFIPSIRGLRRSR
jgi:hypothetical protein